jgi:hypothetical protein
MKKPLELISKIPCLSEGAPFAAEESQTFGSRDPSLSLRETFLRWLVFIFLAIAFFISSCGKPVVATPTPTPPPGTSTPQIQPTDKPLPTVTPACISPEPTQKDIDRALAYTGDVFSSPDWEQNYIVSENSAAVTWQNVAQGAVVYLEALIFPCGYEEPDLNKYYSDENWKAIFANYESYESVAECKSDIGLRLYQFKTQNQGFEYAIDYWVQNDTDTRVISTMIVFPVEEQALLGDYSARLFPDLPNCS